MPLLLLLFLMLVCLPDDYPSPLGLIGEDPGRAASWSLALMAAVILAAAVISFRVQRQLYGLSPQRERVLRRYNSWRHCHTIALCGMYALTLAAFGWGWAIQEVCQVPRLGADGPMISPGAELLVLAPFLIGLVLSWLCFYDAERAIHDTAPCADPANPFWGRGTYLVFHLRHTLGLVLIPVVLMVVEKAFRRQFPDLEKQYPWPMFVAGCLMLASIFIGLPWLLRLVLGLRSLPDGPLRQRLLEAGRRLHFRCSDILMWNTRGVIANAMVVGVVPFLRYVLLTDRLLAELTPEEVEAVFGHEVGHVKHHHMVYYLSFLLGSLLVVFNVLGLTVDALDLNIDAPSYLAALPFVGLLGAYIFVVFGFLSRRCERQADIYGCRAVSCARGDCAGHDPELVPVAAGKGLCPTGIRTFIEALEKVACLNGISRDRPGWLQSWQHSTIARRVEFLQRVLVDPSVEARFQRTVRLVKWSLLLVLGGVLLLLVLSNGWQALFLGMV
jgi:Zn-dependent protease with chaperone function